MKSCVNPVLFLGSLLVFIAGIYMWQKNNASKYAVSTIAVSGMLAD
jgi:hypothetical protein